jgi:hypothetical protein
MWKVLGTTLAQKNLVSTDSGFQISLLISKNKLQKKFWAEIAKKEEI